MTEPTTDPAVDKVLDDNRLPPAARRFLPPGPDLERRARELAELIRQITRPSHIVLATNYGRN
ncbi:MAG TPA: hypothetical protein VIU87_19105 [Mycobacterium sp.]